MATGNSMLAVPDKKTTAVDLYHPLRHYIAVAFGEREAQEAEDDLNAIWRLRLDLEKPIEAAASDLRRDLLLTYYRALASIEPRFPISPDPAHVHSLTFTWFDAFKPSKKVAQTSIHLEKAAIIFNLGSVYSQIALSANRTDAAGLKQACNAFQSAAGAFAYLRDNAAARVSSTGGVTFDLSVECAWMLEKLMLAQAQECFFEKVIGDAKPPALCSKVARQVGLYYEEAYAVLNSPPLNQHFDRSWIAHVQSKAAQFYAEASYRCSLDLHDKEEIAEEICRLRTAINALADAKKYSRGVAQPLLDAVNKLETKMTRNLERAIKENEQVYLMRVPDASSLAPLSSASLVKPMPLAEVLDASKEGLFSRLVPDNDTKALSKYTDIVDGIIRMQAEKLQQASEIARVRLKEMGLPDSILALEGSFDLPLDLKEDVEALQVRGGSSGLEAELQQLKDLRRVNQGLCIEIEELLNKEADEDAHFRSQFGTKWNRPQSSILTKGLQDRLNKFAANIKQAIDSDSRIERAVRDNSSLMAILDNKPIESAIPNLARPIMSLDGNEDAIVGALKQSLRQIENLGAQRAGLEDMLKEMKGKDDILPKMMASTGSQEDLFKKEISKYDQICEEIVLNIEEQDQLLLQIQAQNDEFSVVFNLEDYKAAREKSLKQISTAITKYHEIKENINEGLNFYVTLQDAVTNIKQQCSDFVMTRNIQCQEMVENLQRQSNSYPHSAAQSAPPHVEQPQPGYSHLYTSYATPQQTTPYLIPSGQYQPSLQQSNQPTAYPGWRGGSYYLPQQQASPAPPPPYTTPSPYPPPNQGSYYRPQ